VIHWLSGPWTWIVPLAIFIGVPLLAAAIIWRLRHRSSVLEAPAPEPEPETAQEQTTIEPASGRLIDPEAAQMIGDPRLRWGASVRRRFSPEEYEDKIKCLTCRREILPGQFFWETPLIDRESGEGIGVSFQQCLSCQPGDIAAVTP
jgi:hypothetical protein